MSPVGIKILSIELNLMNRPVSSTCTNLDISLRVVSAYPNTDFSVPKQVYRSKQADCFVAILGMVAFSYILYIFSFFAGAFDSGTALFALLISFFVSNIIFRR